MGQLFMGVKCLFVFFFSLFFFHFLCSTEINRLNRLRLILILFSFGLSSNMIALVPAPLFTVGTETHSNNFSFTSKLRLLALNIF